MIQTYFENIREKILQEIEKATESIVVAVYWFTNQDLFQALLEKSKKGIKVELMVHNDYINNRFNGLNFQNFIDNDGDFYFSSSSNPMHNKFCIIDNKILINGSYNWTYYAEDRNRENILIIKNHQSIVDSFNAEFHRLRSLTEKVTDIRELTQFEIDDVNDLNVRDYLSKDLIVQSRKVKDQKLITQAFEIARDKVSAQKLAFDFDLIIKRKLKYTIGSSLENDRYLILIPKNSYLPIKRTEIVNTIDDNQTGSIATIHYGEKEKASLNKKFATIKISGLPKKPAGEAKMKYIISIDLAGNLNMEKISLDNGVQANKITRDLNALIEEEVTGANSA